MPSPSPGSRSSSPDAPVSLTLLARHERFLWVLAVVFYGIGDAGTTFVGLSLGGVTEAGPIAGPAIDAFGNLGLIAIKIALFFGFYAAWRALTRPGRVAIPLALVVVGALVTVWNTVMILTTL